MQDSLSEVSFTINDISTDGQVSDLDAGTCLVSSTINIPTGSIVVGEFWTTILGSGAAFNDASNPQPVVRVSYGLSS